MQSMPFRVSRCAILEDELRQKSEVFFKLSESDFAPEKDAIAKHLHGTSCFFKYVHTYQYISYS